MIKTSLKFRIVLGLAITCFASCFVQAASYPPDMTVYATDHDAAPQSISQETLHHYESVSCMPTSPLPKGAKILTPQAINNPPAAPKATPASALYGLWIQSYQAMATGLFDGGCTTSISKIEGTDSILFKNFGYADINVKAAYDDETSIFTIPEQEVLELTSGVRMKFCNVSSSLIALHTPVTGHINADGSISLSNPWGIAYANGTNAGMLVGAYVNTRFVKGNSTMTHKMGGVTYNNPIIATQKSANVVTVQNYLGYGQTVEIILNRDTTCTFPNQRGFTYYAVEFKTIGNVTLNSSGGLSKYSYNFDFPYDSSKPDKLNFTATSMVGESYWLGYIEDVEINLGFTPSFPPPFPEAFQGEGTPESPYLIKNADDLAFLAEKVNTDPDQSGLDASGRKYARCFPGKYFRMENDIDMGGSLFTPIGKDGAHFFSGHFDGNGKTLSNYRISPGTSAYASLIARLDTGASIKNLNISKADIFSVTPYSSALVSASEGIIENCTISDSKIYNSGQGAGALAGYAASLKDCSSNNCEVTSMEGYGGGLAGLAAGPVKNCHVTNGRIYGGVTQSTKVPPLGGIIGYTQHLVSDCSFAGVIDLSQGTAGVAAGGIVGWMEGLLNNAPVQRCFVAADITGITGNSAYKCLLGGIGGRMSADITDCHTAGRIDCPASTVVGGITGYVINDTTANNEILHPAFTRCYTSMQLIARTYAYDPSAGCMELFGTYDKTTVPTVTDCWYNAQMTNFGSQRGLSSRQLTTAAGPTGFAASGNWTFTEGLYPRLTMHKDSPTALLAASAILPDAESWLDRMLADATINTTSGTEWGFLKNGLFSDSGEFASAQGNKLALNKEQKYGTDTIVIRNSVATLRYTALMAPVPFEGKGTQASPWLINNKADLLALARMTSDFQLSFPGTYYLMTTDIDLENDETFNGLSTDVQFHGSFDGGGHTVHRMNLGRLVWNNEGTPQQTLNINASKGSYLGFFGRTASDSEVKNLTIAADCKIHGYNFVGSIVGYCYGSVYNCRNHADVTGEYEYVGGIVGGMRAEGNILNSLNTGNVTCGYNRAGGITGYQWGLIANCANTGNVTVKKRYVNVMQGMSKWAGGITGEMYVGDISDCLNAGSVYSYDGYVGGIAGATAKAYGTSTNKYKNDIRRCISYGIVTTGENLLIGGVSGRAGSEGVMEDVYYDFQLSPVKSIENTDRQGLIPGVTTIFTSGETLPGFDKTTWDFQKGLYPTLKLFVDEAKIKDSRSIILTLPNDENISHIRTSATLSQPQGISWSVTSHGFSISDGKLMTPSASYNVVTDTVTACLNGFVKTFPVMMIPELPLSGGGTLTDPFLIRNASEWNALAEYVNLSANAQNGMHFRLSNDIDFAGGEIKVIADGANTFGGDFDGNGKTMKNFQLAKATQYLGIFGTVNANGRIRNLTLSGKVASEYTAATSTYVGAYVGKLYGSIENCTNLSTVESPKQYVAGFAAKAFAGASFINCTNRGHILGTGYLAGICAYSEDNVTFKHCVNEGLVDNSRSTGNQGYLAGILAYGCESTFEDCRNAKGTFMIPDSLTTTTIGGIIAFANYTNNIGRNFILRRCINEADITAKNLLGGIVGVGTQTNGKGFFEIDSCINYGNIKSICTGKTSVAAAGIIAGYKEGSVYSNCYNYGNVSSTGKAYGLGGIAGYPRSSTPTAPSTFTNCHNTGYVDGGEYCFSTGGIVGYVAPYTSLADCSNTGNVRGSYSTGGIAGSLNGADINLTRCWNMGDVSVSFYKAGGISGSHDVVVANPPASISLCWNSGKISSSGDVVSTVVTAGKEGAFGIGGISGQLGCKVSDCANYGDVYGAHFAGGIVGIPIKGLSTNPKTVVERCFNAADVQCSEEGVKGGITCTTQTTYWSSTYNSITASSYVTDFGISDPDGAGTPVSRATLADTNFGEGWISHDSWSFPIHSIFADTEAAHVAAATAIFSGSDTFGSVSNHFKVGTPGNVQWTVETNGVPLKIVGNDAKWTKNHFGDVTLVVKSGNINKKITINANTNVGISDSETDMEIAAIRYFTLDGIEITAPEYGRTVIVKTIYTDGTCKTSKEVYGRK